MPGPWRNYNGAAQGGELYYDRWWECIVYITWRRRTVRLGSLQRFYEKFLIRNLIRYSPPTQAGLYRDGPLQYYFLHGQSSGLGHLLQYMCEYNAESPKQGRKRFNSIVKTIHFSYLPISYLWCGAMALASICGSCPTLVITMVTNVYR